MKLPFTKKKKEEDKAKTTPQTKAGETIAKGVISVQDVIAPPAIEVDFNHLKIGNSYFRTLFISGYPRYVSANWLAPLINFDHTLDISMFVYPVEGRSILDDLRRKIAEMEAEIQTDLERGRVVDPATQAKLDDARMLQAELVKGAERFFQFSLYVTIPANSLEELNQVTKQVEATLGSLLIISKPATLQMEEAFKCTIPICTDKLMITRNMDTTSLATTFPFTSSELTANEGILYGINEHNDSLVIFDRFTLENANSVVFAKSGAGKSVASWEPVIIKDCQGVRIEKIGPLVDRLINEHGKQKIDHEMEGVIDPALEVFTFNKNLQGNWSQVTIAARKKAPQTLYQITTKSGREITITGDHNLVTLKNGSLTAIKGNKAKVGNWLPLPRRLHQTATNDPKPINLFNLLKNSSSIYVAGANDLVRKNYLRLKKAQLNPKYDRYLSKYAQKRPLPLKYLAQILKFLQITPTSPRLKNAFLSSRLAKKSASLPLSLQPSSEFFRILGYFVAEGTLTPNSIHLSQQNTEVRKDIKNCLKKLHLPYFETKTAIIIGARIFVELIKALKLGSNAATKKPPQIIFEQKTNYISSFLRGYFEGDGTVGHHEVTATSKSKELISSLSYLLFYFGIIARIRKRFKRATNSSHQGGTYYQIVISGQKDLNQFASLINFVSSQKQKTLQKLLGKNYNTNIDLLPSLGPILEQIYQSLYSSSEITSPAHLSPLKRDIFSPSPTLLKKIISKFEERIGEIEEFSHNGFLKLKSLPDFDPLCQRINQSESLSTLARQELGSAWRLIKNQKVSPRAKNVFHLLKTIEGHEYSLLEAKQTTYKGFALLGQSLQKFDRSLWTAITQRKNGDTDYQRLIKARDFLKESYQEKEKELQKVKKKIRQLKLLASAELFWDPIIEITKIKHQEKYVYDLTVDDEVFLTGSGGIFVHNSYMVKLEALRSMMFGTEIIIIDPESEYQMLCDALGGQFISFGFEEAAKINPFDLSTVYTEGENELNQKILSLHSLFKVIMGKLDPSEEAALDRALVLTYKMRGITTDPATQKNEPPLMEDLYKALEGMEEPEAKSLADRIEKFVKGSFRGIFDQQSTVKIENPFTVFSIKELEDSLRPTAMFIILDYIWTLIRRDVKRRILVVDEAWYLMRYPDSASFMRSIAKRSRKYYLGLTTITQDVEDFFATEHGKEIVTNSSIQILMKQSPAAIDRLAQVFYLSEGEKHLLLAADIGEGLFFAGANHVAIRVVASPEENELITSKPQELLARRERQKAEAEQAAEETLEEKPSLLPNP